MLHRFPSALTSQLLNSDEDKAPYSSARDMLQREWLGTRWVKWRNKVDLLDNQAFVFAGHGRTVRCVEFTADGMVLVSGSVDNTIKVWDVVLGDELRTLNGHTGERHKYVIKTHRSCRTLNGLTDETTTMLY